jgi:hypothetical protein
LVESSGVISQIKARSRSFFGFIKTKTIRLKGFFIDNSSVISSLVVALATLVIAIYAIFTYGVQKELKQLQRDVVAMQTEPRLSGAIAINDYEYEPKQEFHYRLTNIGSDTAWSVFPKGRFLILCDSMVIYPETYLFGFIYSSGTFRGNFSRSYPIAPAETKIWGFNRVLNDFVKLSNMVGGIALIQVDLVYWSNSPIKRYENEEYFVYNKLEASDPMYHPYIEKLTRPQDRILRQLSHLKDERKIAELTFLENISGPAFYQHIFDPNSMIILSNPVPTIRPEGFRWTYRDTFIVADSMVQDFLEYRRKFSEYRTFEKQRSSK